MHIFESYSFPAIQLRQKRKIAKAISAYPICRAILPDNPPECSGMIQLSQMAQLMNDYIIAELGRKHRQPPIQFDPPRRVTAAPARLKITECYFFGLQLHNAGERMYALIQQPPARLFKIRANSIFVFQKKRIVGFTIFYGTVAYGLFLARVQQAFPCIYREKL